MLIKKRTVFHFIQFSFVRSFFLSFSHTQKDNQPLPSTFHVHTLPPKYLFTISSISGENKVITRRRRKRGNRLNNAATPYALVVSDSQGLLSFPSLGVESRSLLLLRCAILYLLQNTRLFSILEHFRKKGGILFHENQGSFT